MKKNNASHARDVYARVDIGLMGNHWHKQLTIDAQPTWQQFVAMSDFCSNMQAAINFLRCMNEHQSSVMTKTAPAAAKAYSFWYIRLPYFTLCLDIRCTTCIHKL